METESIFFTDNALGDSLLESELSDFYFQESGQPKPDNDEGDDDDDKDTDDEDDDYRDDTSKDDNPPLDKDVVHSPVTTLPGGVPKKS